MELCKTDLRSVFYQEPKGSIFIESTKDPKKFSMGTKCPKNLNLEDIPRIMIEIIDAVLCLHANGVLHRDIKPDNICLDFQDKVKLCDFGMAKFFSKNKKNTTGKGTKWYSAPETFESENYDFSCDVYSVGVTFLDISILARKKENAVAIYEKFYSDFGFTILEKNFYNYKIKVLNSLVSIKKISEIAFMMIKKDPKQRKDLKEIRKMIETLDLTKDDINNDKIIENYEISDFETEYMEEEENESLCCEEEEDEDEDEDDNIEESSFQAEIEIDVPLSEEIQSKKQEIQFYLDILESQKLSVLSSSQKYEEFALANIEKQILESRQELKKIDDRYFLKKEY